MALDNTAQHDRPVVGRFRSWALIALLGAVGGQVFTSAGVRPSRRAAAQAQSAPDPRGGFVNPADQRESIIAELRKINIALAGVRDQLKSQAVNVNVLAMPAQQGGSAPGGGK